MKHPILIYLWLIFFSLILTSCNTRPTYKAEEISDKSEVNQNLQPEKESINTDSTANYIFRKKSDIAVTEDTVKGDFNGDGKMDLMWLDKPKIADTGMECDGNCDSYIRFSDPAIPSILVKDCIDGLPDNLGDLNKNGTVEIGLLPGWFSSCWREYFVWTYLNGKWVFAVEPFMTYCNQWDDNVKPIEIDKNREGFVIIRYTELTEEPDFAVKSKSIKIKK